ncbi:phytanoyl-CoA dioxygenase family protein [Pseudomonas sp. SBB6]|uniref:phytanoyl-CoA dioxygenase family protein n=1 Tax=Pseudomonas sp. SBB6 TaxID=2962032 RepID=UPI0020B6EA62|nr:phytanoyl-CoA dioxygenase family protein [Pseudomonas sp. SBB6]MCP3752991.1 phytanoyl-CoA dioxygenase family protein [Pseudomonas sp. SBB6]
MNRTTAQHLQALSRDGFVVLPGVLDSAQINLLRHAIDRLKAFHWDYSGGLIEHYKCVFNRDPLWLAFLDLPGVIELAEAALGEDCHIIGQTAWRCHPGYQGMPLHLDYLMMEAVPALMADPAFELPMQICTVQLYLDDIDADLCPTRVIAGSHRAGRAPRKNEQSWQGRPLQAVLCQAGDALVFRSELWHAGSDNRSAERSRYMLQVHYGRRMVVQKFSPYLHFQFNPAVLAAATPRQRRLLGEHAEAEYD